MKPTLKAPGTKRLKLKYVELLPILLKFCSNFAFKFNLRRYIVASKQTRFDSPYLIYHERVKTTRVYLRDATPVRPSLSAHSVRVRCPPRDEALSICPSYTCSCTSPLTSHLSHFLMNAPLDVPGAYTLSPLSLSNEAPFNAPGLTHTHSHLSHSLMTG